VLTLSGKTHGKLCDGVSRRDFMRIGGLAMGGLSLPELLKAEAEATASSATPAVRRLRTAAEHPPAGFPIRLPLDR
jgi:hypothetical protein